MENHHHYKVLSKRLTPDQPLAYSPHIGVSDSDLNQATLPVVCELLSNPRQAKHLQLFFENVIQTQDSKTYRELPSFLHMTDDAY